MKKLFVILFCCISLQAWAQAPASPPPGLPQLEAQRDAAFTQYAITAAKAAEAKVQQLQAENDKLKAELEGLKKQLPAEKPAAPPKK